MNVRTLCLAILNGMDSTGYEIRKLVSDGHFSHFIDASYGSIYPALNKLEQDGMVTSFEEQQDGKPNRKVYCVTDTGRLEFLNALSQPAQKDKYKSPFLLLAMCAELMHPADLKRAIDKQIVEVRAELTLIDTGVRDVDMKGADWVANYGRSCLSEGLKYLEQHRGELEKIAGTSLKKLSALTAAE
ncbi:MAG: PadR family transcriptional regulator [Rhizobiaceae bacterium]